jgi:hypothetical protein
LRIRLSSFCPVTLPLVWWPETLDTYCYQPMNMVRQRLNTRIRSHMLTCADMRCRMSWQLTPKLQTVSAAKIRCTAAVAPHTATPPSSWPTLQQPVTCLSFLTAQSTQPPPYTHTMAGVAPAMTRPAVWRAVSLIQFRGVLGSVLIICRPMRHCSIHPTASNTHTMTGVAPAMTRPAVCRTVSLIQLRGVPGSVRMV